MVSLEVDGGRFIWVNRQSGRSVTLLLAAMTVFQRESTFRFVNGFFLWKQLVSSLEHLWNQMSVNWTCVFLVFLCAGSTCTWSSFCSLHRKYFCHFVCARIFLVYLFMYAFSLFLQFLFINFTSSALIYKTVLKTGTLVSSKVIFRG